MLSVDQVWAEGQSAVKGAARQDEFVEVDEEVEIWIRVPKRAMRDGESMMGC